MSAYLCDKEHIAYLVKVATTRRLAQSDGGSISWWTPAGVWRELRCTSPSVALADVANMLWHENELSLAARYGEDGDKAGEISPSDFDSCLGEVNLAQVAKSCNCFEYQSCEHEGWESSEAKAFIDALLAKVVRSMVGYADASWGAPRGKRQVRAGNLGHDATCACDACVAEDCDGVAV